MIDIQMDEEQKQFLLALYDGLDGNTSKQMSMYDVGTALGFDKPDALKIAEALMGMDAVEVRTLSGGIGLTEAGVEAARGAGAGGGDESPRLGDAPVVGDEAREGVEAVATALKVDAGGLGLPFDALTALVADLRTIDAQLCSTQPKTAILRECFISIRETLAAVPAKEHVARIDRLIA